MPHITSSRCFIGFDGFIDTICHVVQTRDGSSYNRYETLPDWSKQVALASQKSANFELEVLDTRLGGNAMILAQAMRKLGHRTDWAANVAASKDSDEPHAVFKQACATSERWMNLGPAGQTQALEFADGKLLLGIQGAASTLNCAELEKILGKNWVQDWLWPCNYVALVNWTMSLHMGQIWRHIANTGWPKRPQTNLSQEFSKDSRPIILIDLADPRKRDPLQLRQDLESLNPLRENCRLILSLNKSEAEQVSHIMGCSCDDASMGNAEKRRSTGASDSIPHLSQMAHAIGQKLPWFAIVIHDRLKSALASGDLQLQIDNPWVAELKVSTGGGDHFNAGLSHALLQGHTLNHALEWAAAYSAEFVRSGYSPSAQAIRL